MLGPGPLLAPEHKVVLNTDPDRARALGRTTVHPHLGMVNYTSNLSRLGWTDEDLTGNGSDALIGVLTGDHRAQRWTPRLERSRRSRSTSLARHGRSPMLENMRAGAAGLAVAAGATARVQPR